MKKVLKLIKSNWIYPNLLFINRLKNCNCNQQFNLTEEIQRKEKKNRTCNMHLCQLISIWKIFKIEERRRKEREKEQKKNYRKINVQIA